MSLPALHIGELIPNIYPMALALDDGNTGCQFTYMQCR